MGLFSITRLIILYYLFRKKKREKFQPMLILYCINFQDLLADASFSGGSTRRKYVNTEACRS